MGTGNTSKFGMFSPLLGFTVIGGLAGMQSGGTVLSIFLGVIVFTILGVGLFVGTFGLMKRMCSSSFEEMDSSEVATMVKTASSLLLPFFLLAVFAHTILGWQTSAPFASSAFMIAISALGIEVLKHGGKKWVCVLIPMISGSLFVICWSLGCTIIGAIARMN